MRGRGGGELLREENAEVLVCVLRGEILGGAGDVRGEFCEGRLKKDEVRVRCVMAEADAGRGKRLRRFRRLSAGGRMENDRAGDGCDLLGGDGAGAINDHGRRVGIEDGGLKAVVRGPGVEDGVDAAVEIVEDVLSGGGTGVAEAVGAGRGEGHAGEGDEARGDGMSGHADADERAAGGDGIRHGCGARQQKGERAGPEGMHEAMCGGGQSRNQIAEHGVLRGDAGDVDADGVPGGTALGLKDARDGGGVKRVCAEAVDGFRWEGDESAAAKDFRGADERDGGGGIVERERVHGEAQRVHGDIVAGCDDSAKCGVCGIA